VRLLYLTPTAAMGGAERVLLDLLALIRAARPGWTIGLIVGNDGPLAAHAAALGVTTRVLPFPRDFAQLGDAGLATPGTWAKFARHAVGGSISTVRYVQRLRGEVAAFGPDIVQSNGIKMHVLGALVRPAQAALVWHVHDYPGARPVTSRLVKSLKSRCSSVVAVSDSVAADIRRALGASVDVRTIWNAVDLERFTPNGPRLDLAGLAGLPPAPAGMPTIGLVATFARWKGHFRFLEMLHHLARTHRFRAYIVGGPLYETSGSQVSFDELRDAIDRLGLREHVGLTGFVTDAAAALRSLDVVVHASTSPEPFGLVIAEAMAAGRTVVVSDAGGVAELVAPEHNALTYPSADTEGMTRQLRRLLDDAAFRARLGDAARGSAHQQFHPDRVCREFLGLYAQLGRARAA
jgi:glycosyltransferase involved in cell wall biosynthesis